MNETDTQEELEYLRWFWRNAGRGFGPADCDIYVWLESEFERETGKQCPFRYYDPDDDE